MLVIQNGLNLGRERYLAWGTAFNEKNVCLFSIKA